MTSSEGTGCTGGHVFTSRRQGEGVFECLDGRSGSSAFVSNDGRGAGQGSLDNELYTFGE